jgi:hypothetical protein
MGRWLSLVVVVLPLSALAGHRGSSPVHVKGTVKRTGTFVAPRVRSAPDASERNNYDTRGNTNPVTGKEGTRDPDRR